MKKIIFVSALIAFTTACTTTVRTPVAGTFVAASGTETTVSTPVTTTSTTTTTIY